MRQLLLLAAIVCTTTFAQTTSEHILGGAAQGTDAQIASDVAVLAARPAGLRLAASASLGSVENAHRLANEPGARLAVVQADVYGALLERARSGDAQAAALTRRLRVVTALFDEELHFLVRADSPLHFVHEIEGQRLNVGPLGASGAFTTTQVYARMFGHDLPAADASFLSDEQAVARLVDDRSVDVVAVVGGQPIALLAQLPAELRRSTRLLAVDAAAPQVQAIGGPYAMAIVRRASYPDWLEEDVPALAVEAILMTRAFHTPAISQRVTALAQALCRGIDRLRAEGHPKWKEAHLGGRDRNLDWNYFEAAREGFANCPPSGGTAGARR